MYRINRTLLLRKLTLSAIILMVLLGVRYISTHGFLVVESASDSNSATYARLDNSLTAAITSTSEPRTLLTSGSYSVGLPTNDGITIRQVEVPRVLKSVKVDDNTPARLITTLGRNSQSSIVTTKKGLVSYESGSNFRPLDKTNISGESLGDYAANSYPEFIQSVQLNSHTIVGVITTLAGLQPIRYDTITTESTFYPLLTDTSVNDVLVKADSGSFILFDKKRTVAYRYGSSQDDVTRVSLSASNTISTNENRPIFSLGDRVLAVTTGRDLIGSNDAQEESTDKDQEVRIFEVDSKKEIRSFLFQEAPVFDVILSPKGGSIFIKSNRSGGIFDLETGRLQFLIPYTTDQFMWLNESEYVFTTQQDGIFNGSLKKKSARTLVSYNEIRPTSLSFVDDTQVYFTGFTNSIKRAKNPDAYVADLSKSATSESKAGLSEFPHQGEGFYIDYIDRLVTVEILRYEGRVDQKVKQSAEQYISDAIGKNNYKIRYTYTDFDF